MIYANTAALRVFCDPVCRCQHASYLAGCVAWMS